MADRPYSATGCKCRSGHRAPPGVYELDKGALDADMLDRWDVERVELASTRTEVYRSVWGESVRSGVDVVGDGESLVVGAEQEGRFFPLEIARSVCEITRRTVLSRSAATVWSSPTRTAASTGRGASGPLASTARSHELFRHRAWCRSSTSDVDLDGRFAAVVQTCDDPLLSGLWVVDLVSGGREHVAVGRAGPAKWSPDGSWLVFGFEPIGSVEGSDIWMARTDGSQLRAVVDKQVWTPARLPPE